MSKKNVEDIYPLSPMQRGMLFHTVYAEEPGVYIVSHAFTIEGRLDVKAFFQALQAVVDRHAILRTAFLWERREEPLQVVREKVRVPCVSRDLRGLASDEQALELHRFAEAERLRGFDPGRPPLLRASIFQLADDRHRLFLSLHHLLLDGWSLPIVLDEVFRLYAASMQGEALRLDRPRPYGDYIAWLQAQDRAATQAFWRSRLAGFSAPTPLGVDHPARAVAGPRFGEVRRTLAEGRTEIITSFCRRHALTPGTLMQAAWALVLARYSGEDDVLFGATVSGRSPPIPGIASMVGLFINTLPSRIQIDPGSASLAWLTALQAQLTELRDHEHTSLVDAHGQSDVPRGTPLFESLLVFENFPFDESIWQRGGLRVVEQATVEHTSYPLTVVGALRGRMFLRLSYDRGRFDAAAIERMIDHLETALLGLASHPERTIREIPLFDEVERRRLLAEGNDTDAPAPDEQTVEAMFERCADRAPEAIAIEHAGTSLRYGELEERSNRLAHVLRERGVGPEVLVGVLLHRTPDLVIALLGILKAGGAYVPLDPELPPDRLSFLLGDAAPPLVLTESALRSRVPVSQASVLCLDHERDRIDRAPAARLVNDAHADAPAYVLYTSGSTGRPKGVVVLHRGVVNYLAWARATYPASEDRGAPVHSSIGFDLTVTSLFVPLISGRSITLIPEEQGVIGLTAALRGRRGYGLVKLTPSHLELLAQTLPVDEAAGATRSFVIGGESLLAEHLTFFRAHAPETRLFNEYGPTETVVGCCVYEVPPGALAPGPIPIGRPIANTRLYVLDPRGEPVPPGVAGELYIGGAQVARGYWNRPDLTAERFVPDPFSGRVGARLYRTGDRVRRLPSGDLDFLGRFDHQVKLRGHRIELGEIEATLLRHPGVREAVVLARADAPGEERLVAYVVVDADHPGVEALKRSLRSELPAIMIPTAILVLPALPLTAHGKVDRRALPAPEASDGSAVVVEPRGPIEQAIAGIFAEVLRIPPSSVGARGSFFELGGHSLLVTAAISRIRSVFGMALPLRALFEAPTPADLAARVEEALRGGASASVTPIAHRPATTERPPSFAEERLWFLNELDPGDPTYVVPLALRLTGPLDHDALERATSSLLDRHPIFRTAFPSRDGRPVAVVRARAPLALSTSEHPGLSPDERATSLRTLAADEARRPFDLATGPLLRAHLLRFDAQDHALLLSLHHIVSDAWTLGLVHRELGALYGAFHRGEPNPLPEPPIQYADYAAWQRDLLAGPTLDEALRHAHDRLEGGTFTLDLPADRPAPLVPTHRGGRASFDLGPTLSKALRDLSRREGTTPFMTLLAAYVTLLHRTSGQTDLTVGTPIANRSRPELLAVPGLFLNTLVLRARPSPDLAFRALLAQIKATCLDAYTHQDVPFERLVDALSPDREPGRAPLFQVMFTLESAPTATALLEGVEVARFPVPNETAKFDLTLAMAEGERGLSGLVEYSRDRFDPGTIDRLIEHFTTLLGGIVATPDRPLSALPLLPEAERRKVVEEWNATEAEHPEGATFPELFEAQATRTPEAPALRFQGRELRYRELLSASRRLSRHLRVQGVGVESRVGLCVHRSPSLVIGLLGILGAGAAYVPLDPSLPPERLGFMASDAGIIALVTEEALLATVPVGASPLVNLDRDRAAIDAEDAGPLSVGLTAENAAYVIYTSGSSGQPKGVLVEHRGLGNVAEVHRRSFGAGPGERVLQFSSIGFDASVWEICMALLTGGTLVLASKEALLPGPDLVRTLRDEGITALTVPPSILAALPEADLPLLQTLVVAGETCGEELVTRWGGKRRFWNAYGPTETTICATMGACESGGGKPGIGRPIANMEVFVVDAQGAPLPIGVAGELWLGGVGLARGYLNRPELTASTFVSSGLGRGGRLYRSGDRGRWRADGTLEFLGRIDDQVKLRGFRIEPGEIEAALRAQPDVDDAVVVARPGRSGDRLLVAYVVQRPASTGTMADLERALRARLPDYMVPSVFMQRDAFPLLPSGKVDRRALPAPDDATLAARPHIEPRGPVEEGIAAIFGQVLGVSPVGAHDGFFALGGHSLLATQAMARIRTVFGAEIPLKSLFESPTPAELALIVGAALGAGPLARALTRLPPGAERPLSFAQERLWFLNQLEPDDTSYVVPLAIRLRGNLDTTALEAAITALVRRHEVLRTTFEARGGRPALVLHEAAQVALPVDDLRAEPDPEEAMRREATAERRRPFDLARGPLVRARLHTLGEGDHVLLLSMHHIVSDAWSNGILVDELFALYGAALTHALSPLPPLPIQYVDYAAWQRDWLQGSALDHELGHWRDTLAGAPEVLDLPTDRPRPLVPSRRGAWVSRLVPPAVAQGLIDLSRRAGTTLFMTLLAAFEVLLHRYTGQSDLVVGTPIANRTRTETEGLIGFFINTLVLRTHLEGDLRFDALLARVKDTCLAAYAHQDLPFERLVQELRPTRDLARTPLFQVMFGLQNTPRRAPVAPGLTLSFPGAPGTASKFDLTLGMVEAPDGLLCSFEYATDLFDEPTIARMLEHLFTLLEGIVASPSCALRDLPLLPPAERHRLLVEWNPTAPGAPAPATFAALFEAWVDRAPDAPALRHGDQEISYRSLDEQANQLAHHLQRFGVGPEVRVGLSVRRSPALVIGILGILKAGGAYVPLDPRYPRDRLELMLDDASPVALLSEDRVLDELPALQVPVIALDGDAPTIAAEPRTRPPSHATAASAAYVIYTSGSTGRPKGVVVEHRGLGNVADVHRRSFAVGPGSRVLQFSSMSFDASVWELCMALLNGATLVLAPEEQLLPGLDLQRFLLAEGITHITVPPSALAVMPEGEIPSLTTVIVAGEACPSAVVDRWAPGRRFWNAYGPTEATICATMAECFAGEGKPTIGSPIAGVRVHLLDEAMGLSPIGVPGELYIGGIGLARGYLHRPDLTAERFVPSPYEEGERLYRTGDLCRRHPDGAIEFLGRLDQQVKIRGHRIEPGEIEAALAAHPAILEAAVSARDDGAGALRLVAYFVTDDSAPTILDLRAFLEERLPEHLLPSAYVPLIALPRGPTGKVDHQALPAPEARAGLGARVGPRGPIEELIAAVWTEVLEVPEVGVHDDFFDLGGHSLLATQVMGRIATLLGVEVPLQALFEAPTIAALAERVSAALRTGEATATPPIEPISRGSARIPSFAQERLWFLAQLEPESPAYVVPLLARFEGKLDRAALDRALGEIVRRHEVLRTTFPLIDGRPTLLIDDAPAPETPLIEWPDRSPSEREQAVLETAKREARHPIDLAQGPLFRACLFQIDLDDHALFLLLHHIVADAWAIGVLHRELGALYRAYAAGEPSPLPELSIQYADFAAWQRRWLQGEVFDRQLAYWRAELDGAPTALDLPTDRPRPPVLSSRGARRAVAFSPALTQGLRDLSRRSGVTLYMTLLAALGVLLHRLTGQEDLLVGTPIANRTRPETEALIGFFLNTLVLRLRPSPDLAFEELLRRVKATSLGAHAHQDMPFERLVQELHAARDLGRSPLFQVLFSLQNAPGEALDLPGLHRRSMGVEGTTSKFDLSVLLAEGEAGLFGSILYSVDLFDASTIDRLAASFETLLLGIVATPALPVGDLPMLPESERETLLVTWNDTATTFPGNSLAPRLFEEQAGKTPDAVAMLFEGLRLTYREVDARSARIAQRLRALGVGPDVLVGICLERSLTMVIAVLAVLRAGGAYVPLDPEYPRERLAFMLEDARAPVLLTETHFISRLPAHQSTVLLLDLEGDLPPDPAETPRNEGDLAPHHLAYVIYTSGSTGAPKGAMNTQAALRNRLLSMQRAYPLGPSDRVLHKTPFSFDVSVWELLWPLTCGASLVIAGPGSHRDAAYLARTIAAESVTTLHFVPSMLQVFLEEPGALGCRSLRRVYSGGEALSPSLVNRFYERITWAELHNLYGPAEAAIDVTSWPCRPGVTTVPIGRPFHNVRAHVLDARGALAPIGVRGELHLGGVQVGRGYLHRPDLTAARFIPDPFAPAAERPGARLYRTGDLCRVLPTGDIEFLGRADHQVKLRGFRIELGEIEAALRACAGVEDAVVIVREDTVGERRLVAYLVTEHPPMDATLRSALAERLPEHLIPALFIPLSALPLSPNGKVDRAALPAPSWSAADDAFAPPRTPIEEAIAALFVELLALPRAGLHDDFFARGGHSLLAARLVARLRALFAIELPLRAIFASPTVVALAGQVEHALRAGAEPPPPLVPVPRDGAIEPSFAEERLWFLDQLAPNDTSYLLPSAVRITGRLDVSALARALTEIARRHEILRATFHAVEGRPRIALHPSLPDLLTVTEAGPISPVERDAQVAALVETESRIPIDLAKGPLVRAHLIRFDEADSLLLLTLHHIVSDGGSRRILDRELSALYGAFSRGEASPLPELPLQSIDHAAWQRRLVEGPAGAALLAQVCDRLAGAPFTLDLPTDRPRPTRLGSGGAQRSRPFPADLGPALQALSRREGATLFMTLLGAFATLLHRLTGQDDLVIGTAIETRALPEVEGLIGLFVNTLPLRARLSPDLPFSELLQQIKETCLAAYAHQDLPFERLVEALSPPRDPGRTPLFQVMFLLQRAAPSAPELPGLVLCPVGTRSSASKFDLTVAVIEGPEGLTGAIEYRTDLFDASTIDRMLEHFTVLLQGVARAPSSRICSLPLLPEAERRKVVEEWNATEAEHPEGATFPELFEAQATRTPEAPALRFEGSELRYRELLSASRRLSRRLRAQGVGVESRVGLCLNRSPSLVIGLLGILGAGAAYVPLDPSLPPERLGFMASDAGIIALVTEEALLATAPAGASPLVNLDRDRAAIDAEDDGPLSVDLTAENAAYVIYTSGSSGQPKGVLVEHRGLGNVAEVHRRSFGAGPGERVLQFSSIGFDASVWEICMALLTGGTLVLASKEALLPGPDLVRTLRDEGITALTVPPSILAALPEVDLPLLQTLVVAGEACGEELVTKWGGKRHFWNAYGPTETTICATMGACESGGGKPGIGRPIANMEVFVVDAQGAPLPIGVAGELWLGGVGLARGYLNRPELTASTFVSSGLGRGGRLYRSGDRGRWRADGTLEFLGRIDDQVKLRGFRIEPGEIEAALRAQPDVDDAVVIVREDRAGDPRLVGYVVGPSPRDLGALDQALRRVLPDYLVPSALVSLLALPLTPSGKVDRRALPAPEPRFDEESAFIEPRGPIEEGIAVIFADVLGLDRIGAHEGFFARGGHSLLGARAIARIRDTFGVDLPLQALFEAPTPAALAERVAIALGAGTLTASDPIVRIDRRGDLPLSFAQERLWFLDQLDPGDVAYVVSLSLRLRGPLDDAALERALREILRRHEVLRSTLATVDGRPHQQIHEVPARVLVRTDLSAASAPTVAQVAEEERRIPFDLARGPLFRATLVHVADDDHALFLATHHVVSDGWSNGVLLRELGALYAAFTRGEPSPLAELPIQYVDHAAHERARLGGSGLDDALAYWKQALHGAPTTLDLPLDHPRPATPSRRGGQRSIAFSPDLTSALIELSHRQGATLYMTLLAAFFALLHRLTGQRDLVVGTPIASRERTELEGLIGFFVNTLVLRAEVGDDPSFTELLAQVKATCLAGYAHQDVPFERLVDELAKARDLTQTPLFQVMFVLQNAPREAAFPGSALAISPLGVESGTAKFDLTLSLVETPTGLRGSMEYRADLFEPATIDRMLVQLDRLLQGIVASPAAPLASLPLLTVEEQAKVLSLAGTTSGYPRDASLASLFEAEALAHPEAIALRFGERTLSYRDLDQRANRLAHVLRSKGVDLEAPVGLFTRRSLETVIAILAILKAGGAYVPLDPDFPEARNQWTILDARIRLVIATIPVEAGSLGAVEILPFDGREPTLDDQPSSAPVTPATGDHLAYILYTSGSTGVPKGVCVTQRNVVRLVKGTDYARFGRDEVFLQLAPLSFDASTLELWGPLLHGGELVIFPLPRPSLEELGDVLQEARVTTLWLTAGLFNAMIDARPQALSGLRQLLVGGEALSVPHIEKALIALPEVQLINGYGPTEGTTFSVCHPIVSTEGLTSIPIGRPVANTLAYVLDPRGALAPIGVPGELYIGGDGVARGYLDRPELTAERFLPSPFVPGDRLYRTGDRVRWLADGTLEFLGRLDQQVKVRGYRIELGEIESVLSLLPAIRRVVVVAREDQPGEKRLVAYLVSAPGTSPSVAELRSFLRERLPEHLVPSTFVLLDALPLTPNGKVDRRALPAPTDQDRLPTDQGLSAPRGEVEEELCRIWAEVLRLSRVGVHDNFFEIGGDSILSIQIVARAERAGLRITPRQLFQHQTIAELATVAGRRSAVTAEQGIITGSLPLTPIQRWWLEGAGEDRDHFNQSFFLELRRPIAPASLGAALEALIAHHDMLRVRLTSFEGVDDQRIVAPGEPTPLWVIDLGATPEGDLRSVIEARAAEAQRSLRLSGGPVLRAVLLQPGRGLPDRLLLIVHHLAVDSVSWRVLLEDLWSATSAHAEGRAPALPPKTTSFRHWAMTLERVARAEALGAESAFWLDERRRMVAPLPLDEDESNRSEGESRSVVKSLPDAETEQLLRQVPEAYQTQITEVLLTALVLAFERWTGDASLLVDLEGHGREEISPDLDVTRTVGWFTALYPVLLSLRPEAGPGEALKAVKEQLRAVPGKGLGHGLSMHLRGDAALRDALLSLPSAEVSFNYLGQLDGTLPVSAPFAWARESAGPTHGPRLARRHRIEILGSVAGGRLHLRWVFGAEHRPSTIEALAAHYLEALQGLITHCLSPGAGGYTPSDFQEELSQDLVDLLSAMDAEEGE